MIYKGKLSIIVFLTFLTAFYHRVHARQDGEDIIIGKYRKLYSKILNEERTLLIRLPDGYEETQERYPVLILMDADNHEYFMYLASTAGVLANFGRMPHMIVVGIANTDRTRDMLPVNVKELPTSGGADNFLRFMTEELVPFINHHYRTAPYRILYGASNAGLFAVYALLTKPEPFHAYIAGSPMIGWCSDFIKQKAESLFQMPNPLNNFLYIIYGEQDYRRVTSDVPAFIQILETRAPAELEWKVKMIEKEGHVPYTSLYDGLTAVFHEYRLPDEIREKGFDEIKDYYARLSEKYSFPVKIPFVVLLPLGYHLMELGKLDEAIAILELNVKNHPQYPDSHYYLAESYRKNGDDTSALEYYKKTLELNPDYLQHEIKELIQNLEEK